MESTLRRMFDYQRFENNTGLQMVIDDVHSRYAVRELNLEEMNFVAAAGIIDRKMKEDK